MEMQQKSLIIGANFAGKKHLVTKCHPDNLLWLFHRYRQVNILYIFCLNLRLKNRKNKILEL